MAEFKPMVITKKGQSLIAKMLAGSGSIEFVKISVSSDTYSDEELLALTELESKQTTLISKVTKTSKSAVQVEGSITNAELENGYYMNTIALYANDPDEGEIIYAACGASVPGWMPPYNGVSTSGAFFKLITTVSNAENVVIEVDPAAVATVGDIKDLQSQISDLQGFVGYNDKDIYGVEVDFKNKKITRLAGAVGKTPGESFDSVKAFGGRRRCMLGDDTEVITYYGDENYFETGIFTQYQTQINDKTFYEGETFQVMVEQPRFYYKVVPLELEKVDGKDYYHMRKVRYYISDTKKEGFKLHPAFIRNGQEYDFIYMAAYEGCFYNGSEGKYILDNSQNFSDSTFTNNHYLSSIAGAKPATGGTRPKFRSPAESRGDLDRWSLMTIQSASVTELLFLIEYASFDMQSNIGIGVTNKDATSSSELTGATSILGNKTGSVTNENGFNVISYRGEENFFGNVGTWIDGINIYNYTQGKVYIADTSFADDTSSSSYKDTGISILGEDGYISAFAYPENENFDWLFIPSETLGNSSLPVGDKFKQTKKSSNFSVVNLGGSWKDGSDAGGFYFDAYYNKASASNSVGSRLLCIPYRN